MTNKKESLAATTKNKIAHTVAIQNQIHWGSCKKHICY